MRLCVEVGIKANQYLLFVGSVRDAGFCFVPRPQTTRVTYVRLFVIPHRIPILDLWLLWLHRYLVYPALDLLLKLLKLIRGPIFDRLTLVSGKVLCSPIFLVDVLLDEGPFGRVDADDLSWEVRLFG